MRTTVVILVLAACWFVYKYARRIPEFHARLRAWRNRRRHPDFARDYRWADEEDRIIVVQQMMMRDRLKVCLREGSGSPTGTYPEVFDYYIPPGRIGWIGASAARESRRAARQELLQKIMRS